MLNVDVEKGHMDWRGEGSYLVFHLAYHQYLLSNNVSLATFPKLSFILNADKLG